MRAPGSPTAMLLAAALGGLLLVPGLPFAGSVSPWMPHSLGHPIAPSADGGISYLASATVPPVSNGVVDLQFSGRYPSYTLSSVNDSRISLGQVISGLAEVNQMGQIVASANYLGAGVNWSFTTGALGSATLETLAANVTVVASNGSWESGDEGSSWSAIGHVATEIGFQLNASTGPHPSTLSYTLTVSAWPWRNTSHVLGVEIESNAASGARLAQEVGSSAVRELDNATNGTLARYFWDSEATASYTGGTQAQSSVGAFQALSSGGAGSLVKLNFTQIQGGYFRLSYDPWVSLNLAVFQGVSPPAWLVTPQALAVIGAGIVVAAGLAVVAWRQRRTPPPQP